MYIYINYICSFYVQYLSNLRVVDVNWSSPTNTDRCTQVFNVLSPSSIILADRVYEIEL